MSEYKTHSPFLAAFLVCAGAKLLRVEPGARCTFVLSNDRGACERAANEYYNGEPVMPVRELFDAERLVRFALNEAKDEAARVKARDRFEVGGTRGRAQQWKS